MIYTELQLVRAKQMGVRSTLLATVAALGISLATPVAANAAPRRLTNQDRTVTSTEVKQALANTAGVLESSSQIKAAADADSAQVTMTAGATVDVPKDATRGVKLAGKDGSSISVGLPNAGSAGAAQRVANGVVSYPSATGAANAVQTNADGSVRMLTVIDNPGAPTRYDYTFTTPVARLVKTTNGGVVGLDIKNEVVVSIDKPWAKDANGLSVSTNYVIKGTTLTQYVYHKGANLAYPVTADPNIQRNWFSVTIWFTKSDMGKISSTAGAAAALGAAKFPQAAAIAGAVAWAANEARNRGYCLAVHSNYISRVTWLYRC